MLLDIPIPNIHLFHLSHNYTLHPLSTEKYKKQWPSWNSFTKRDLEPILFLHHLVHEELKRFTYLLYGCGCIFAFMHLFRLLKDISLFFHVCLLHASSLVFFSVCNLLALPICRLQKVSFLWMRMLRSSFTVFLITSLVGLSLISWLQLTLRVSNIVNLVGAFTIWSYMFLFLFSLRISIQSSGSCI